MTTAMERFAARLANVERSIMHLRQPQLASSSVEDGALGVNVNGQATMQVGRQYDGTSVAASLTGPVPPTPHAPAIFSFPGGILVTWDGYWTGGDHVTIDLTTVAPMDFKQVDVVVATTENANFIATVPTTTMLSARGGSVFLNIPDTTIRYVALVARTESGKPSVPSAVVSGAAGPPADGTLAESAYNLALSAQASANGNVRTFYQPSMPWANGTTRPEADLGALWVDSDDPAYPAYRWLNNTWTLITDTGYASTQASLAQVTNLDRCKLWLNGTQLIPTDTWTWVPLNAVLYDTNSMASIVGGIGRITIKRAGLYSFMAHTRWGINGTGWRGMSIKKNHSSTLATDDVDVYYTNAVVGQGTTGAAWNEVHCDVGDFYELQVHQTTGSNNAALSGALSHYTYLSARLVAPD